MNHQLLDAPTDLPTDPPRCEVMFLGKYRCDLPADHTRSGHTRAHQVANDCPDGSFYASWIATTEPLPKGADDE